MSSSSSSSSTAPPAPAKHDLVSIAKTLQFSWFVGHVLSLFGSFIYAFSAIKFSSGRWAIFWYKEALLATVFTYGIVLFQSFKGRRINPYQIILDDNVQYLGVALLWLFTSPFIGALAPFASFSLFHVLVYTKTTLFPAFNISSSSRWSVAIGNFIKNYNDKFLFVIAHLELLTLGRVIFRAILFKKGSWITLLLYSVFLKARFDRSPFTKTAIRNTEVRIDSLLANPSVPPVVKQIWISTKGSIRSLGASAKVPSAHHSSSPHAAASTASTTGASTTAESS